MHQIYTHHTKTAYGPLASRFGRFLRGSLFYLHPSGLAKHWGQIPSKACLLLFS